MKTKIFLLLSVLLSSLCFSQGQDITKHLLEYNPAKILKLLSSYEIIYTEKSDESLLLAYETEMPITLFNQQIKPLRWEIKNGELYSLFGTIEEFDKDISDHPAFGISNYISDTVIMDAVTEEIAIEDAAHAIPINSIEEEEKIREEMVMKYKKYLNDNSQKKQALNKEFTAHFSSYKEDVVDCQFDCFSVWKMNFGWIVIEKNNFSEKINDKVILSIKNIVGIFFDKDMDPDRLFGSDNSSQSVIVEEDIVTPIEEAVEIDIE